jgi:hypothetical protein
LIYHSTADARPFASTLLICFSHLRWDFVFQRPQHLMSRFARSMEVLVWEEPVFDGARESVPLGNRLRERGSFALDMFNNARNHERSRLITCGEERGR